MKLISMVDLVLQGYNINQINNYANFLKQPLKLEMFVPCGDDGNVFEEPSKKIYPTSMSYTKLINSDLFNYQQAKEKVLFEGLNNKEIFYYVNHFETIEDLIQFDLTLTQTAINKLGL